MASTSAQIRNKALQKLGILAHGATASSEAADDMDKAYNEVYAHLDDIGIAYWQQSSVPDEVTNQVASMCAWARINDYLVSEQRYQRIRIEAADAHRSITAARNGPYASSQSVTSY